MTQMNCAVQTSGTVDAEAKSEYCQINRNRGRLCSHRVCHWGAALTAAQQCLGRYVLRFY